MAKVLIHTSGGVIHYVAMYGSGKIEGVIVVDTDVNDCGDEEGMTKIIGKDGGEILADIREEGITPEDKGSEVHHLVDAYHDDIDIDGMRNIKDLPLLMSNMRTQEGRDKIAKMLKKNGRNERGIA